MSLPRYPEYKHSGVEWLGEVPGHWAVVPLKYVVDLRSGGTPSKERVDYWNGTIPWASSKDLKVDELHDTVDHVTELALEDGAAAVVAAGASLVVVRGMILAHSFPVVRTMRPMAINQDLKAVLPRDSVDGRFLSWLLRGSARESLSRLDEAGHGTKALRMDAWTSMELPIPPVNEQVSISKFLDRETAKIDALVAEQQRLIELLQEKRQAVISHAVTKGLDPDASVRRTEIEWLGDIPSHWNVAPLKFLAEIRTGIAKGKDFGGVAVQEVPYLRVANVQDGYLDLRDVTQMPIPVADLARYRLQAGDVLMNEGGDFDKLGRGAVWAGEIDPCVTQNHVFAVRPYSISSHWLAAYTGSASAQFYFMSRSKQSTNLASISSTNIMELPVPVPPREEQLAIIDHIKAQASAFEQLVAEANSAVRLMTEHRAALIAAAVTGQIDVRGVATAEAA